MTTRIDVLAYWIITLCSAIASGQNFDRLLPPRETRSARTEAYRPQVNSPRSDFQARPAPGLLQNFDYRSLRDEIDRDYRGAVGEIRRSSVRPSALPPAIYSDRDGRQADYRGEMRADAQARVERERVRYEQLLQQQERSRGSNSYDNRNWDRFETDHSRNHDAGGCSGGNCTHDPNVRPIGYGYGYDDLGDYGYPDRGYGYDRRGGGYGPDHFYRSNYRDAANHFDRSSGRGCPDRYEPEMSRHVARAAFESPYIGPRGGFGPSDYRDARLAVDREGNHVRENLYGEPRVFNPDQPVRNLFRYLFP